jgi:ferredoxin
MAQESASVRVDGTSRSGRLIVFVYNERGEILGILKPVVNGAVTVRRGDYADFRLPVHGSEVGEPVLLKAMDHYLEREDMFDHLASARSAGRSYGLQRCLFPICNRCLDGCRTVITTGRYPLKMQLQPGGFVHPAFESGKCPRCGICFTWCPSGSLVELRKG